MRDVCLGNTKPASYFLLGILSRINKASYLINFCFSKLVTRMGIFFRCVTIIDPRPVSDNRPHIRYADFELVSEFGNSLAVIESGSNLIYLFPVKNSHSIYNSYRVSALLDHIGDVILRRSNPQMIRVYASGVVASMQDPLILRNWTFVNNPRGVVGWPYPRVSRTPNLSVAKGVYTTRPIPAGFCFGNLSPKSLFESCVKALRKCGVLWDFSIRHNQVMFGCANLLPTVAKTVRERLQMLYPAMIM